MIARTEDDNPNGGGYEVCRYVWGSLTGTRELWRLNMNEIRWSHPIDLMRQNESFVTAAVLISNIVLFYNKHMRNVVDVVSSRDDAGNS
jgi:hypothetical protein